MDQKADCGKWVWEGFQTSLKGVKFAGWLSVDEIQRGRKGGLPADTVQDGGCTIILLSPASPRANDIYWYENKTKWVCRQIACLWQQRRVRNGKWQVINKIRKRWEEMKKQENKYFKQITLNRRRFFLTHFLVLQSRPSWQITT